MMTIASFIMTSPCDLVTTLYIRYSPLEDLHHSSHNSHVVGGVGGTKMIAGSQDDDITKETQEDEVLVSAPRVTGKK